MRYRKNRLQTEMRRCDAEVTTFTPPGATEGQCVIEFCDAGHWLVSAPDYWRIGRYDPDADLPDAYWEAMEGAEAALRRAGMDHIASSVRQMLAL